MRDHRHLLATLPSTMSTRRLVTGGAFSSAIESTTRGCFGLVAAALADTPTLRVRSERGPNVAQQAPSVSLAAAAAVPVDQGPAPSSHQRMSGAQLRFYFRDLAAPADSNGRLFPILLRSPRKFVRRRRELRLSRRASANLERSPATIERSYKIAIWNRVPL